MLGAQALGAPSFHQLTEALLLPGRWRHQARLCAVQSLRFFSEAYLQAMWFQKMRLRNAIEYM